MQIIKDSWSEKEKTTLGKIQSYFRLLSQIEEGAIIALYSNGPRGKITIFAYGVVVSRHGSIYEYNKDKLVHHIHVEYIDDHFTKKLDVNYAGTLHQLSESNDKEKFYKVFGWLSTPTLNTTQNEEVDNILTSQFIPKLDTTCERSAIASLTINLVHNRIQNSFIKYLEEAYHSQTITGEKDSIDAKRETHNEVFIYEIKPYQSVYACIREGIGQLLDYSYQLKTTKEKRIIIVGPNEPTKDDLDFISTIKSLLQIPFSYIAFDEESNAKEYPIVI